MSCGMIEAEVRLAGKGMARASDGAPLRLAYDLAPYQGRQRRLRGRLAAVPRMPLADYRVSACVDWIELKFETARKSQNRHVATRLARFSPRMPRVTDWEGREGRLAGTHHRFIARLQEPGAGALGVANAVSEAWGLVGNVRISGIEISLDIFPNDGSDEKRWLMTTMLTRAYRPLEDHMRTGNDQARFIVLDARGEMKVTPFVRASAASGIGGLAADPANHNAPPADATASFGAVHGPVMVSIQNKISDQRVGEVATVLPQNEHRTRVEVRLSGVGLETLGLEHLDDLDPAHRVIPFADLRKPFFDYRLPTFDPTSVRDNARRTIFAASGIAGLEMQEQKDRDMTRCESGPTIAFSALNDRLWQALNRLDERWGQFRRKAG